MLPSRVGGFATPFVDDYVKPLVIKRYKFADFFGTFLLIKRRFGHRFVGHSRNDRPSRFRMVVSGKMHFSGLVSLFSPA